MLSPPGHAPTRTAVVRLIDGGTIYIGIQPGLVQTVADADENIRTAIELAGHRAPAIVDIRNGEPLSAETRHFYSGKRVTEAFSALGLLVDESPLGRTMANVYFRVVRLPIPIRLFTDEAAALAWAKEQRNDR